MQITVSKESGFVGGCENLEFYVGNDHKTPLLLTEDNDMVFDERDTKIFNEPTGSLGANLNRLIKAAKDDGHKYLFQLDDDHILKSQLDLGPHIEKLKKNDGIGWIRLMGIAAHNYKATLKDDYWEVDWNSPELYITSNRPHLKTMAFQDMLGPYPEGQKLGQTEERFCHQAKDLGMAGKVPHVAVPLSYNDKIWDHVGDSWQGKGF